MKAEQQNITIVAAASARASCWTDDDSIDRRKWLDGESYLRWEQTTNMDGKWRGRQQQKSNYIKHVKIGYYVKEITRNGGMG